MSGPAWAVVILVLLPFVVYFTSKLAVLGALRGRQLFERRWRNDFNGEEDKR